MFLIIYQIFFLNINYRKFPRSMISWPYACMKLVSRASPFACGGLARKTSMKQHEASSPHPECYIFPIQHEQDGLTVLERERWLPRRIFIGMIALQMWV